MVWGFVGGVEVEVEEEGLREEVRVKGGAEGGEEALWRSCDLGRVGTVDATAQVEVGCC